ncbi:hypothetical protein R3P38DRAFT_2524212, partial [Favolaschia claudopus]
DIYRAVVDEKPVALIRMRHFVRGSNLHCIHLVNFRETLIWKELHHPYMLPLLGIDRHCRFPNY